MGATPVRRWTRTTNYSLDNLLITSTTGTPINQVFLTGHAQAVLLRAIAYAQLDVRIGTAGTPPPEQLLTQVMPFLVVQFDAAGPPSVPAQPASPDSRIIFQSPMKQLVRPSVAAGQNYSVRWYTDPEADTSIKRDGAGAGGHYPTVTSYLWTNDPDNWLTGVFYDHRKIDWMGHMSVLWGDTT